MADVNNKANDITIWDDTLTKNVTVVTDGSIERLAVDIQGQSFSLDPFVPRTNISVANTALATSPSWTTIANVSDEGSLDFIAIAGSLSTYRVRLLVDTVQIFDVTMANLASIGLSNATNVPLWAETADKNFRFSPRTPVDFVTNFTVEAQQISGSPTVNWLVLYRLRN